VPEGWVPDGGVPEGAVPFICPPGPPPVCPPSGGVPEGAVPFICTPDGVPEGAVLLVWSPAGGVPDGVIAVFCSADWLLSVTVLDEALLPDDWVELVELVHPAIMMPAIRIAEAISMSVMLFFMGVSPLFYDTARQKAGRKIP